MELVSNRWRYQLMAGMWIINAFHLLSVISNGEYCFSFRCSSCLNKVTCGSPKVNLTENAKVKQFSQGMEMVFICLLLRLMVTSLKYGSKCFHSSRVMPSNFLSLLTSSTQVSIAVSCMNPYMPRFDGFVVGSVQLKHMSQYHYISQHSSNRRHRLFFFQWRRWQHSNRASGFWTGVWFLVTFFSSFIFSLNVVSALRKHRLSDFPWRIDSVNAVYYAVRYSWWGHRNIIWVSKTCTFFQVLLAQI